MIYAIGYNATTVEELQEIREKLDAVIVDIRYMPYSRNAKWNRTNLIKVFPPGKYRWVKQLGNVNYKGGPVYLYDPAPVIDQLVTTDKNIILMCMCAKAAGCHREDIKQLLRAKGVEVEEILTGKQAMKKKADDSQLQLFSYDEEE